ncbi:hypothetical protein SBOR_3993 [Sclerotinia borealis F-4128]|uniref:Uncharacterized protein n=1 Tax=Sclerotinia borealis (strain F-4128) TaxID=1432307 RepID=W9CFR1_SCLBF|nr:hypothetical protein SBOR_3993 [Sclerotinia borealis F-4128]
MFFSPFITGLLPILAATSTQIETSQHPSIFILSDHTSSTSALGNALQTLGYTHISPKTLNNSLSHLSTHTFTELPTNAAANELMIQYPNTKFIVPISSTRKQENRESELERRPCANSWLTHLAAWSRLSEFASDIDSVEVIDVAQHEELNSIRSSLEKEGRLLEISLDEREHYRGEKWLRLCKFLDLGYSVVERLNLKEFPSSGEFGRKAPGWGANLGKWGLVVQGSGV